MIAHAATRASTARFMVTTLLVLALVLCPLAARAWWKDEWSFRKRLDIDASLPALAAAAGSSEVVIPVRLHAGNFGYFGDAKSDGSDLRFVAADDATPLDFRIERFDAAAGFAVVWLRIPAALLSAPERHVWMYYGNEAAAALSESRVDDAQTVLSYDFAEPSGVPRDATAFATSAQASTAQAAVPALIDLGLGLSPQAAVMLPPSPALAFVPAQGFSLAAWVKPDAAGGEGLLYSQSGDGGGFVVTVGAGSVAATLTGGEPPVVVTAPLAPDAWHAIGVSIGERLTLFVDGREAASSPVSAPKLDGPAVIGASGERPAFTGTLDALRLSNVARAPGWFQLAFELQRPESTAIGYGDDESSSGGGLHEELALIGGLLRAVTIDGWIVIGLIVVLGLFSADVLVRKLRLLGRTERADKAFLAGFAARWQGESAALAKGETPPLPDGAALEGEPSVLGRLYRVALAEAAGLPARGGRRRLSAESAEVIRGALDARLVEETERMQRRLVLMTIAVSGGPFLGLLGTVVGVMITFAAVAATGDVNVNTIAPGISAALFATVMGLLVAIPSLFGYNLVATRIAARVAAMEVFADQMVGRLHAALAAQPDRPEEVAHAA
jgi:biopolymer transport protein ExbB